MEDLVNKMQELLSNPESMKQISELAQMFQSGNTENLSSDSPPVSSAPDFDPSVILKAVELFRNQPEDKNISLLLALRPHLRQPRQEKLDKAVKMLKLWHVWKQLQSSGMLQNLF